MSAHAVTTSRVPHSPAGAGSDAPAATGPGALARAAVLAYGVLAYASFVGAFLYAVGFVGNWVVPRSIDSGKVGPLIPSLAINTVLLVAFVVQHTIMARPWFKRWWTRIVPTSIERSTFVVAASGVLFLLFWQWRPLPRVVWEVRQPALAAGLAGLSLFGYALAFASSFMVSHTDLFGLRQTWHAFVRRVYAPVGFRIFGLYRLVRHPLMVGFLIAFWATPVMTVGHLFFAVMTTGYIFFGTFVEERDLVREHGEDYLKYRRATRGFAPLPKGAV
jgi:protein-S-isoprenylcysteine O-methyltransferase Ste14